MGQKNGITLLTNAGLVKAILGLKYAPRAKATPQAGAGAVTVTLNGHYGCVGVSLGAEALQEDREMLEALIAAAVNDATQKVQAMTQSEMAAKTVIPCQSELPSL